MESGCNAAEARNLRCRAVSLPSTPPVAALEAAPLSKREYTPRPRRYTGGPEIRENAAIAATNRCCSSTLTGSSRCSASPTDERPPGTWQLIEGIPHFLSSTAAEHLHDLARSFELVWCSGWEERADEHLPTLLGVPALPHLSFERNPGRGAARTGSSPPSTPTPANRPLAWIDDALDDACEAWAAARAAPTLLVRTDPATGLTAEHVAELDAWAARIAGPAATPAHG